MSGDPCELENLLRSDRTPSSEALNIASILHTKLVQLKNEKGYNIQSLETSLDLFTEEPANVDLSDED